MARDVGEGRRLVGEEHRAGSADRDIERSRFEGMDLRVALDKGRVGDVLRGSARPGAFEHPRGEVDSHRRSSLRGSRRVPGRVARAAADIEDSRLGRERGSFHSYAILGFLAIRPWTTYELAQQMQRTLNRMWPRARSKLYEEPKKLVAHGLATASKDAVGRRTRTVYAITPAGRRALAAWLRTPSDDGMALESEHLVKLFFADHGRTQDALATLEATKAWALEQLDVFAEAARVYLAGEGEFRERAAVNMVGARFMVDFYAMVADWTDWASEVVASWPDHPKNAEPDWELMEELYRRARSGSTPVGQTGAGGHPRRRSIR